MCRGLLIGILLLAGCDNVSAPSYADIDTVKTPHRLPDTGNPIAADTEAEDTETPDPVTTDTTSDTPTAPHLPGCSQIDGSGNVILNEDCDDWFQPLDCNDTDSTVFPDAAEIPGDGIDQNCDGIDTPVSTDFLDTETSWIDSDTLPDCDGDTGICSTVYCGDGILNTPSEECDLGVQMNKGAYGGCTENCTMGPHCGDGMIQEPFEQCDLGPLNGVWLNDSYGCTQACMTILIVLP